jgi:hypothetical protein
MTAVINIEEINARLIELEKRVSIIEGKFVPEKELTTKKISIKEFFIPKSPKDSVQKTLLIGYYLEHYEGLSSFNIKDLEEGFRSAREPVPQNLNDKVNMNINKGHIMPVKEEKDKLKAWVLTNTGERIAEEGFEKKKHG